MDIDVPHAIVVMLNLTRSTPKISLNLLGTSGLLANGQPCSEWAVEITSEDRRLQKDAPRRCAFRRGEGLLKVSSVTGFVKILGLGFLRLQLSVGESFFSQPGHD